jgi:lipopolysaccharide/colanic/teichoic acid biosynthesis glycosyltransferase
MPPFEQILKRTFDIAVAYAGLLLMSPLILLVVLAIKLYSRERLVCRYTRYLLNDTEFEVFEFRSKTTRRLTTWPTETRALPGWVRFYVAPTSIKFHNW